MPLQTLLFETADNEERIAAHVRAWRDCWDWIGPEVGGYAEICECVVETENGDTIYAYCDEVRLIELRPDGRWLAEVTEGEITGWDDDFDGDRVVLDITDIWPPTRRIRKQQQIQEGMTA